MNPNSKTCKNKGCDVKFTPFNSLQKYCSWKCTNANKKPTVKKVFKPIPKMSEKRKKETALYLKKRIVFLEKKENKICPVTGQPTTDIHHTYSGKDRAKYYLDESTWIAVSRTGHNWIHDNPKEAREKGLLK